MGGFIKVACVCTGQKYPEEYVRKLYNSVALHCPHTFAFYVLSDQDIKWPAIIRPPKGVQGYWNKLALFKPGTFERGDRVLYFDLDILVRGPLDALFARTEPFIMARDGIFPHRCNSSLMMWTVNGATEEIWREWDESGRPLGRALQDSKGDQAWTEMMLKRAGTPPSLWQDLIPGAVLPYYSPGEPWGTLKDPANSSVVIFHGKPRLHELATTIPWVKEAWR